MGAVLSSGARARTAAAALVAAAVACTELKTAGPSDGDGGGGGSEAGSSTTDGAPPEAGSSDGDGDGGLPKGDSGVGPSAPCRTLPLECLDPASPDVIEVPETSLDDAFATAKAGDTVQVRGRAVGSGWRVPPYVTLRGCAGALIRGSVAFAGSAGIIEGFIVDEGGTIVANQTGSYVVRHNRFASTTSSEPGVSGRSIDALVSASVTLVVESNLFEGRRYGVQAATRYDTMTHTVDITIRNNVFSHVERPISISEGGLVGIVTAKIEHNTFYDFDTAIALTAVDRKTPTSGNLFVSGVKGIEGSPYDVAYSFAWMVTTPAATPPVSGTFATGDPALLDADGGDFRLGPSSEVVDRIPNEVQVPAEDYFGCPRPAGAPGAPPKSDVGAIESQP